MLCHVMSTLPLHTVCKTASTLTMHPQSAVKQVSFANAGGGNVASQAEGRGASAAAVEALRVIKMAKLRRHGPPSL